MEKRIKNIRNVLQNPKYLILSLIIALVFYEINVLISNVGLIKTISPSLNLIELIKDIVIISINPGNFILPLSLVALIIISLLIGVLFSLLVFKAKITKSGNAEASNLGIVGIILAVLVPGCATCGVGLISALGLSAVTLSILPLKGFEISLVSIIILLFAISKVSKELYSCKR